MSVELFTIAFTIIELGMLYLLVSTAIKSKRK